MSFMTLRGNMQTPPAQWFADPTNPSQLRWWDGRAWTEHVAPMTGLPATRAAAQPVSPTVTMPPATATPAPETVDDDPSDILRRVQREMEWTDLDRPLDEQVEVVGEQYYPKEIRKLFRDCGLPITPAGVSVENEPCFLVPEPWNPHDPNAVAVMVRKYHVGHLPADLAKRYHPVLIPYAQRRLLVTGVARVWSKLESGALVRARVTIAVPEVTALLRQAAPPSYRRLPLRPPTPATVRLRGGQGVLVPARRPRTNAIAAFRSPPRRAAAGGGEPFMPCATVSALAGPPVLCRGMPRTA